MNKYLILSMICFTAISVPMDQPVKQYLQPSLMGMPVDMRIKIITYIGESSTLEQALDSIKSLACVSKHFKELLKDSRNLNAILEKAEREFQISKLEIAQRLNTPAAREIKLDLEGRAEEKFRDFTSFSSAEKNLYNYAEYLRALTDSYERKEAPSYLHFLYYNSANHTAIFQAIQSAVANNNAEQVKLWCDSGHIKKFS